MKKCKEAGRQSFPLEPHKENVNRSFMQLKKVKEKETFPTYSPLRALNPRKAISPISIHTKIEDKENIKICSSFVEKHNISKSALFEGKSITMKSLTPQKQNQIKKSEINQLNFRTCRDLEAIKNDALKSKIYTYLET